MQSHSTSSSAVRSASGRYCFLLICFLTSIFTDPAFGIMTRVDSSLRPKPPAPPLSLSDYLDCLQSVREKLFALQIILQEYSSAQLYETSFKRSSDDDLREAKDEGALGTSTGDGIEEGEIRAMMENPVIISDEIHSYIREQVYMKRSFSKLLTFIMFTYGLL